MVIAMLGQDTAQEFYTWGTLLTLGGAAGAAVVVATVVGSFLGDNARKWAALLTSFGIMFVVTANGKQDSQDWMIAVLNSFLVFATATGINSGAVTVTNRSGSRKKVEPADEGVATRVGRTGPLVKEWF